MTVHEAIAAASRLLPGAPSSEGIDPRWQGIIQVSEYVEASPDEVWGFAAQWGCSDDPDLRSAIATCILEHLLEHHFSRVFPLASALARTNANFAQTIRMCWRFGESENPANILAMKGLLAELRLPPNTSLERTRER
jgi:hypothetical protein